MTLRTPLGRVRGLGAARSGVEHWWRQRLTAVVGIPLIVFLILVVIGMGTADYAHTVAAIRNPWIAVSLMLAIAALAWHMQLGMQVIIEDYIHVDRVKKLLLIANSFFAGAVALAGIYAVVKIGLGAP
ncbi:MAG: succinate dehydrogenase, hydrophobic membrane anchor protein [Hyphomicrobiales bacterium]